MGHYAGQNRTKTVPPTNGKKREEGSCGVAESRHFDSLAMSDCYQSDHGYTILYLSRKIAWKHELRSGLLVCISGSQIFLHITWRIMVSSILVFRSLQPIRTDPNALFLFPFFPCRISISYSGKTAHRSDNVLRLLV